MANRFKRGLLLLSFGFLALFAGLAGLYICVHRILTCSCGHGPGIFVEPLRFYPIIL